MSYRLGVDVGGTFTDFTGKPTMHAGEGVATNGHVFGEVIAITKEF